MGNESSSSGGSGSSSDSYSSTYVPGGCTYGVGSMGSVGLTETQKCNQSHNLSEMGKGAAKGAVAGGAGGAARSAVTGAGAVVGTIGGAVGGGVAGGITCRSNADKTNPCNKAPLKK